MTASFRELIHSKDQLIMDVSHELRSPVTRIKVALEMLKGDNKDDGSAGARMETLEKNIQELEDIISTILESQRINLQNLETEMHPQRLGEVIRESVELQRDAAPGFDISGVDMEIRVNGDRSLLKLLIHNLLDNAVKYSHAGSAPVRVCLEKQDGMLLLQVIDDGIGIEAEHLQRVFDPFYKVARERGFNSGYGLGLSLCRRIAALHSGEISLENNPGGGVNAKVLLPLA
jgi:signal transduction histidine kinase